MNLSFLPFLAGKTSTHRNTSPSERLRALSERQRFQRMLAYDLANRRLRTPPTPSLLKSDISPRISQIGHTSHTAHTTHTGHASYPALPEISAAVFKL